MTPPPTRSRTFTLFESVRLRRRPRGGVVALALGALGALLVGACGGEADPGPAQAACDPDKRPVVMVHGFLAAGDTWGLQAQRFRANGYCDSALLAFDWNTLAQGTAVELLDAFIDAALVGSSAAQVDLVGHSAGGGLGYRYLAEPARAAKVANYVHVGSSSAPLDNTGVAPGPAGPADAPVPTLNLYSDGDTVVASAEIPGAVNVMLAGQDHYQVATSAEAFAAMYAHLHGGAAPATTEVTADSAVILAGKALTLGENTPVAGWTVDVWEVEAATGGRVGGAPAATFTVAADGAWGPFEAAAGTPYELHLVGLEAGDTAVHYYVGGATASNRLVYLRALPGPGSLVGALLGGLPRDDRHAVVIAFSSSRAVIHGRDTLSVDGRELATAELATAERTAIAFFAFDEDVDQASGGEAGLFAGLLDVFLAAVDAYLPADAARTVPVVYNGVTLNVRSWPSASDGVVVAILP